MIGKDDSLLLALPCMRRNGQTCLEWSPSLRKQRSWKDKMAHHLYIPINVMSYLLSTRVDEIMWDLNEKAHCKEIWLHHFPDALILGKQLCKNWHHMKLNLVQHLRFIAFLLMSRLTRITDVCACTWFLLLSHWPNIFSWSATTCESEQSRA